MIIQSVVAAFKISSNRDDSAEKMSGVASQRCEHLFMSVTLSYTGVFFKEEEHAQFLNKFFVLLNFLPFGEIDRQVKALGQASQRLYSWRSIARSNGVHGGRGRTSSCSAIDILASATTIIPTFFFFQFIFSDFLFSFLNTIFSFFFHAHFPMILMRNADNCASMIQLPAGNVVLGDDRTGFSQIVRGGNERKIQIFYGVS